MATTLVWVLALLASGVLAEDDFGADADQDRALLDSPVEETVSHCDPNPDAPKPNVFFFLADDLGFNDISWNNDEIVTPNLQALAEDGVILDRNYVQPVCSPSRGALHTGKYAHRIGMHHSVILSDVPECMGKEHVLLSEELKEVGYKNHLLGKWHLGFCNEDCMPLNRGFDTFHGFYNGYMDHYTHVVDGQYDMRDGKEVDLASNGSYTQTVLTDRAIELIGNHDGEEPMFMMMSSPLVHTPLQLAEGQTVEEEGWRAIYKGMLTYMDSEFARIIQAIKDNGLYENSIIIFSSDNGAMSQYYYSSNEPLRGAKYSVFEGGTRVPAMFHSPLATVKNTRSEEMFHITDWYPTILELAGGCATDVDGVSQIEMLLNGGTSARTEMVYNMDQYLPANFGASAFRMGDYKLVKGFPGKYDGYTQDRNLGLTYMVDLLGINDDAAVEDRRKKRAYFSPEEMYKYAQKAADNILLYNVMDDPEERTNLAADMPELVKVMEARIQEHLSKAVDIDLSHMVPDPAARDPEYNGVWTTGWC